MDELVRRAALGHQDQEKESTHGAPWKAAGRGQTLFAHGQSKVAFLPSVA